MRVALFTNNYLPFRGGVTTAVETLRLGLRGDTLKEVLLGGAPAGAS